RVASRDAYSLARKRREQCLPLASIDRARALDVLLVVPGDDRRALHELLRRRADRRPELLERGDEILVGGDEPGAVAGHGRSLAERVEHRNVPAVACLERGMR